MGCTCGHETYGAHLRAKNIRVAYCNSASNRDATSEKRNQRELALYASTRAQGIQPASTKTGSIREALDTSDRIGRAFDAGSDSRHALE